MQDCVSSRLEGAGAKLFTRQLILLALLALGPRLAAVVAIPTQPISDFWSYMRRAQNLVERGEYAAFPGHPDATFPPAYPLLLAVPIALGIDPVSGAKIVNAALGALAVLAFGALARAWFGSAAGLAAAALVAFHPRLVLLPTVLASENLFLPLLGMWLYAAGRWLRRGEQAWALWAGGLLGLATLTRAAGYALWLPLALVAAATGMRRRFLLLGLAALLAATHFVLLPWWIRNGLQLGLWTPLTSSEGVNLFMGYNDGATGRYQASWKEELEKVDPGASAAGLAERHRRAARAARAWILDHPAAAAALYVRKLVYLLTDDNGAMVTYALTGVDPRVPPGGGEALPAGHPLRRHPQPVRRLLDGASLAVLALAIAGLILAARQARRGDRTAGSGAVLAAATALYFPLLSAVYYAQARYRWPAEDVLLVLAAPAAAAVGRALASRLPAAWHRLAR